jgi:ATP-dependent helicase/nuclease subunit A
MPGQPIHKLESQWITAHAGSGKTRSLTWRVVRLMLHGVAPERIIGITYTRAAASEMRGRILSELGQLAASPEAEYLAALQKVLGHVPDAAMKVRGRRLCAAMIDSPSGGVMLTTIHGFCQNILRQFPYEADLSPQFTVLDEATVASMLARCKHQLMQSERLPPALADAMQFISRRMGEQRFETILSDCIKRRRLWQDFWRNETRATAKKRLYGVHGLPPDMRSDELTQTMVTKLETGVAAAMGWRALCEALSANKYKAVQAIGDGVAQWRALDEVARAENLEPLLLAFYTKQGELRKNLKPENFSAIPECLRVLEHMRDVLVEYQAAVAALACAEESFAIAELGGALCELYTGMKAHAQALDFEDMIEKTLQLMAHPATLGWVMQKLDHRIDHLLIDEAQDNSRELWQLARVLAEELLAAGGSASVNAVPRSLMVVGDEKQSIYSFQGAAPEAFASERHYFMQLFAHHQASMREDSLDISYRSSAAVLNVVNAYVDAKWQAMGMDAAPGAHQQARTDLEGRALLHPLIRAPKPEAAGWEYPQTYTLGEDATRALASQVAAQVAQWVLHEKRWQAQDILILCHKRGRLMPALIRALQAAEVPVAGMDRLVLGSHLAVRDVLALMRWCCDTSDDLALAQVLRSPLVGMSESELCKRAHGRSGTLATEINHPWLDACYARRHLPAYEFLSFVLEESQKRQAFIARFGAEVEEVLDELLMQLAALPAQVLPNLSTVEPWIKDATRQVKRESEPGAQAVVRLMTVHGAKGLQAPVVIIVDTLQVPNTAKEFCFSVEDATYGLIPALSLSESSKQASVLLRAKEEKREKLLAEYRRLLYVAMTRAAQELHVFAALRDGANVPPESWYAQCEAALKAAGGEAMEEGGYCLSSARTSEPPTTINRALADHGLLGDTNGLAWLHEAAKAEEKRILSLSPSRLMVQEQGAALSPSRGGMQERGTQIHRMLEMMQPAMRTEQIESLVAFSVPDWPKAVRHELAGQLGVLQTTYPWLWARARMAEQSISGTLAIGDRRVLVCGQMDLLVDTGEFLALIDYKTTANPPTTPAEIPQSYGQQLAMYRALLTPIYPSRVVRCGLLYTHVPRLIWLEESQLQLPQPNENVMPA